MSTNDNTGRRKQTFINEINNAMSNMENHNPPHNRETWKIDIRWYLLKFMILCLAFYISTNFQPVVSSGVYCNLSFFLLSLASCHNEINVFIYFLVSFFANINYFSKCHCFRNVFKAENFFHLIYCNKIILFRVNVLRTYIQPW